ncbi:MAG: YcaO-like family protein [Methanocellales archaeon]|nr:YcaO-like family protein [Methanocellales archaeon]
MNEAKVINRIYQTTFYNDEPKVYSFSAQLRNTSKITDGFSVDKFAGGSSFSKDKALMKAIGEALERHSLSIYREGSFVWDSYSNLKEKAINPENFIFPYEFKIKSEFKLYNSENNKLNWIKGYSLTQDEDVFVPAQLVFVPYRYKKNEPVIQFPISTGAASYSFLKGAILEGLLEVIERDAFMIYYLNKISPKIVDIENSGNKMFEEIISSIKRYNLELYILDISTEVPVYSILAIIIDRTGLGPAISLGMKSDLSIKNAIIGSVEEAFHGRFWIRSEMIKKGPKVIKEIYERRYFISDIKERGLLWSGLQMIDKIKFFLEGGSVLFKNFPNRKNKNLNTLLDYFKEENVEILYVDVTPPNLERRKIYTVKVLIPQFQPLYLDERFPYWKGKRLEEVPKKLGFMPLRVVNKFPHPFL